MSEQKPTGRLMKWALAAVVNVLLLATGYGLLFIVPTGHTQAFIRAVKDYAPYLAFLRWGVMAVLYGLVLWQVNVRLSKGESNSRQKQFLSGLRWQALVVLLLIECVFGPQGLTQLGR